MKTFHLKISGKVQGVFFRATAKKKAQSHNLTGWVANTGDHVEAIITGTENEIQSFILWAKEGPERAHVADVKVSEVPMERFDGFSVR